jgi:hypothetical protein
VKIIIIIITLLIVESGFAQLTVKKSTIDSGGTITHNGNTTMLYTVGELAVLESVNANISISEGFINPEMLTSLKIEDFGLLSGIAVYPNPTVNYVNLNFEHQDIYNISIFNINGKQLVSKTVNTTNYQLDFTNYAQSVYLVVIKNNTNRTYRTFKIIKN